MEAAVGTSDCFLLKTNSYVSIINKTLLLANFIERDKFGTCMLINIC